MLYLFDSSALVKRYHREAGTLTVLDIFEQETSTLVICSLSLVETLSALTRHGAPRA